MTDAPTIPPSADPLMPDPSEEAPVEISIGSHPRRQAVGDEIPPTLAILPIRNTAVFPGTIMPLEISRDKSKHVLDLALAGSRMIAAVAQRDAKTEDPGLGDLYRVGTACVILKMYRAPDGTETIIVHGRRRVGIEALTKEPDFLEAIVHPHDDPTDLTNEQKALAHNIRGAAARIIELSPQIPDEAGEVLQGITSPGVMADFLASNLSLGLVHKQELLETFDVTERLNKVNLAVAAQLDVLELSQRIQVKVKDQVDKSQREYYLREQMKAIRHELGDVDARSAVLAGWQKRIEAASMPEAVKVEATREADRLARIPQASSEYGMALDYLEWLVEMPWSTSTEDNLDIARAEEILNTDHYGLDKIKKRILEYLAVRQLKPDTHGPILCFAGPPGVGKTSLGQSIARAMGRKFIRISLGGIRDEASIRGHRRTYIGALPGRIIREIRRAGSNNPLFMLDEVDKIGQDVRGDPMSALLEVLDPAQNGSFADHYLGVPFDLSKVLFISTANYMYAIEPALRDRMEVIELSSYTRREKLRIAERYLLPRQLSENGLTPEQLAFDEDGLKTIISGYTAEAGVRSLERKIGAVCRSRAVAIVRGESPEPQVTSEDIATILGPIKFESEVAATEAIPGVVTGLAFTMVGGEILFIEASVVPGRGSLTLTGQLGDVMRESAQAAISIVRRYAHQWQNEALDLSGTDLHIHVPAGAVPKDGPSAGVAMIASIISALTDQTVEPTTGMTGEITLSGRVLPVGGIREKVLAAHRAGLTRIILPARNEQDLDEIPDDIREEITFVLVSSVDELLTALFGVEKKKRSTKRKKKARRKTAKRKKKTSRKKATRASKKSPKKTPRKKVASKRKRSSKKTTRSKRSPR